MSIPKAIRIMHYRFLAFSILLPAAAIAFWSCNGCGDYTTSVEGDTGLDGDADTAEDSVGVDNGTDLDGDAGEVEGPDASLDAEDESDVVIPAYSSYPKTFISIWGNASPAWYAEFDLAITVSRDAIAARELNPDLILSDLCDVNACRDCLPMDSCPSEWCVRTTDGSIIDIYGLGSCLGDTSSECEEHEGRTFTDAAIDAVMAEDWVNLDGWTCGGFYGDIGWLHSPIDMDEDGDNDGDDNRLWRDGRIAFMQELRGALGPDKFIIMNNGLINTYWGEGPNYINGCMAEMFMYYSRWPEFLENYRIYAETGIEPHMTIIDNHARGDPDEDARSKNNFRFMRFGLAAALLYDGYYGYKDAVGTAGIEYANEHHYNRYYDEFDVPLGEPLASNSVIKDEVFCRFFEGGAMILNGSTQDYIVTEDELKTAAADLGLEWDTIAGEAGHYYRFAGQQNPGYNDGSQFDEVLFESKETSIGCCGPSRKGDGILLVRRPGQVVMADVIIDTEDFVTSPGAGNAIIDGFTQSCDYEDGFRTGGSSCNDTTHPYKGHARANAGSDAMASFEAELVHEGLYKVYEYHPNINGSDIPFTIVHADGEETKTVDQNIEAEQWNELGEFRFTPDAPARVLVDTTSASGGEVAADAIKFEWIGP